jgi:hypothetical protein
MLLSRAASLVGLAGSSASKGEEGTAEEEKAGCDETRVIPTEEVAVQVKEDSDDDFKPSKKRFRRPPAAAKKRPVSRLKAVLQDEGLVS